MAEQKTETKTPMATKPKGSRPQSGKSGRSAESGAKKNSSEGERVVTQSKIVREAPSGSGLYLGAPKGNVPADVRKNILYNMKMTREVDDRVERKLYRQGKILGGVYTGRGQEAISVGFTVALDEKDFIIPSHRDMGVFIARGMSLYKIFAQYLGRKDGPARGKDVRQRSRRSPGTVPVAYPLQA